MWWTGCSIIVLPICRGLSAYVDYRVDECHAHIFYVWLAGVEEACGQTLDWRKG
jgi:hypothetical protein